SLPQLNTGADPVPVSCIPKFVEAPGASLPFHATLTAITVPPDVLTVAFHALTIRWSPDNAQVTDQVVAVVAAVLATEMVTTPPPVEPLPHCASLCAVAWHPPVTVAAEALRATARTPARAGSAPIPATSPTP